MTLSGKPLPASHGAVQERHRRDELGGVDVYQNVRPPSYLVAVARRCCGARPRCSVGWQSMYWVAPRELHGEDEAN